jgi:AcrR family transcriptional regulator
LLADRITKPQSALRYDPDVHASPTERPPRKDAVRNRARLIDAATRAFRENGLDVSVNAVADYAGVNVATLYRHFPTKDDLIAAVLEAVLEPLVTARDRALAANDTGDALAAFVHEAVRLQGQQRGLADALEHYPAAAELRGQLRETAVAIVTPLVDRAHHDGELRPEFEALDLLVVLQMLAGVAVRAGELPPDRVRRYVDLVLRGLRPN